MAEETNITENEEITENKEILKSGENETEEVEVPCCDNNCSESDKKECKKKEHKRSKESELIDKLNSELDKQKELLMRTAAEFDNYKRRTEKERAEIYERAAVATLKNLLQIIDNAERASSADKESEEYAKGIEMIAKQLSDISSKLGLSPIGEVGETFDPNIHEAIMHIEDDNFPENTVSAVMQKGYKYGNTVIRPAMVQVAN